MSALLFQNLFNVYISGFFILALANDCVHHLNDLFSKEGHRPREDVQVVGQAVRRLGLVVLLQREVTFVNDQHRCFVLIIAAVVGRGENRDDVGEGGGAVPAMHLVTFDLDLMAAEDAHEIVAVEKFLAGLLSEEVGTLALFVINIVL